jgi:hypothetical protein
VPRGFLDASHDHAVIRDWWRREPKANIGLRTGGGHFVLDLDDAAAVSWFANSCGRHGCTPRTLTARTSRGFHVFFACSAEVPNSAGRVAPGVDVRGTGGYVVGAGSVHPSGFVYSIARDLPIAEAPQWLVDLAMPDERPAPPPPPYDFKNSAPRVVVAKMEGLTRALSNCPEGNRNSLCNWAGYSMRQLWRAARSRRGASPIR